VRLPEHCLRLHGLSRIKLAMDPFLGLGSTAVACAGLGIPSIGVEIDEGYLSQAVERTKAEAARQMANSKLHADGRPIADVA
jgi:site-specific DNA-methyltransferase (adenine-specific)